MERINRVIAGLTLIRDAGDGEVDVWASRDGETLYAGPKEFISEANGEKLTALGWEAPDEDEDYGSKFGEDAWANEWHTGIL